MGRLRIAIVGAGAMGGWLGALAAEAGHDVSLIARGAHLAALRDNGLRLESGDRVITHRLAASDDPAALGPQDFVLITLKNTAMASVAPTLGPLLGPDTAVVSLMNGVPWWFRDGARIRSVDPDGVITRAIEPRRLIGGVLHAAGTLSRPGVVRHASGGTVIIGEPDGSLSGRCERLAEALRAGGLTVEVTPDVRRAVWTKLLGNLAFNGMSALTGATTDRLIELPETHALCAAVMREAVALGSALGLALDVDVEARIAQTRKLGSIKSSMLQDVEAGRPIEIDAIVGAVVELADGAGLQIPHVRTLHALLKLKAETLGLVPAASPA